MKYSCVRAVRLLVIGLSVLLARMTLAHREDYIDETLVFQTVQQHAVEPEYWFDYGTRPGTDFTRHHVALEYGITSHLMLDCERQWIIRTTTMGASIQHVWKF